MIKNSFILKVNKKNLILNYKFFKNLRKNIIVAATIKANAYGLGDKEIFNLLKKNGCKNFFVATLEEGIGLNNKNKNINIFVLNGIQNYSLNNYSPCLGAGENGVDMGYLGQGCELELQVIYIHPSGSDELGDGHELSPYATIQFGIESANEYDTVYIYPGIYNQSFEFLGKNIVVTGAGIENTTIDGTGIEGPVVEIKEEENHFATLQNLKIMNGEYNPSDSYRAAVVVYYADPTIRDVRITQCEPRGMYFVESNANVHNVEVDNNVYQEGNYTSGGGIYLYNSPVHFDSIFVHSNVGGSGGGIMSDFLHWPINYPTLKITNSKIINNTPNKKYGCKNRHVCSKIWVYVIGFGIFGNSSLICNNKEMARILSFLTWMLLSHMINGVRRIA